MLIESLTSHNVLGQIPALLYIVCNVSTTLGKQPYQSLWSTNHLKNSYCADIFTHSTMFSTRIGRTLHQGYKFVSRHRPSSAGFNKQIQKHEYFSTTPSSQAILRSPFPDVKIPDDVNVAHHVLNEFPKHGNRVAFVSIFLSPCVWIHCSHVFT